ncbi:MAG: hypothetical protein WA003_03705 [Desulfuromonadaceae bacterium]
MRISEEELREFIRLYKEEFGEELSIAEASEVAGNFVSLYEFLAEPLPGEQNRPIVSDFDSADPSSLL